ncbi:MAG: cytochrome c maturation protein CcmE [candidate division Zixibacteria bacterium]|nr:cytochrome c maturation protein CcmE [candidate division Zixibacteria bacterium]
MKKQKKFLVGFGLVIAAIGYLIYTGATETTLYYLTVSELHAAPVYEQNIRLNGKVVTGTIQRDEVGTMRVRFMAEQGGRQTPIVYTGIIPDTFKDESDVVVEGTYGKDGTFTAHTLLAKCPSKYENGDYSKYENPTPSSGKS